MQIDDSYELEFGLVGTIKLVGNLTKNVSIRSIGVVEARCVDKEASLVTNLCFIDADIDRTCEFLVFYLL